jgi:DNA-3-methyladenine glycosylase II
MAFPSIGERHLFLLGVDHLRRVDPKLRQLIRERGTIEFEAGGDPFTSLVEAIISQQLNGQAAKAIYGKLTALIRSESFSAEVLRKIPPAKLRKVGVSPQKIRYLKDLSSRVVKGRLDLEGLSSRPDQEVMRILDEVKGIGPWTVHMFLLFTLGRADVLPVGDLGIQMSIRKIYSLGKLPKAEKIEKIAENWHPYCSVASLYLWHAIDS